MISRDVNLLKNSVEKIFAKLDLDNNANNAYDVYSVFSKYF